MKKIGLFLFTVVAGFGQTFPYNTSLQEQPLPLITNVNLSYSGSSGSTQYCYWVVARYGVGNTSPSGPFCVTNAATSGTITVTWTQPTLAGVPQYTVRYDVIRLVNTVNIPANGACTACLLSNAVSTLTATDTLGALGSNYTLNTYSPTAYTTYIDNITTDRALIYTAKGRIAGPIVEGAIGAAGAFPTFCNNGDLLTVGTTTQVCQNGSWASVGGGGGGSSIIVDQNGSLVGTATTLDLICGTGLTPSNSFAGGTAHLTCTVDTNTISTRVNAQGGGDNSCIPASGSPTAYTCTLAKTLTAYVNQMHITFKPDVNGTGGTATNLNIDSLGNKRIFANNGTSDPTAAQLLSSGQLDLVYDGTLNSAAGAFRIMSAPVSAGGTGAQIAGFSVCAAAGCILNETANWTYAAMVAGTIQSCGVVATTAPTGSTIIVDILKNGTSIYGGNPKTTVGIGSTTYAAVSTFATSSMLVGDLLTAKVTQIDSNGVGQFVRASCLIQ